jgi:hypothetical protein
MGLRFRRSFELFPGVRLNVSKSGVSATFGVPGANLNVGRGGLRTTVGIPGSGLSYTQHHGVSGGRGAAPEWPGEPGAVYYDPPQVMPSRTPMPAYGHLRGMREIGSASVEQLTSDSLAALRDAIVHARTQRRELDDDLRQAREAYANAARDLERRRSSIFRFFYKSRIADLEVAVPEYAAEVARLEAWLDATHIDVEFETSDSGRKAYAALVRAFEGLRSSARAWDVTSDRGTNRIAERTSASRVLMRHPACISFAASDLVRFAGRPMCFENVNGEDILIYPGFALMPRPDGAFALIDLRDLQLQFDAVRFIEDEVVPGDAQIVDMTRAKVNKNGARDLRFRDNYQIPICVYGRLLFTSVAGIEEEYQFSNMEAAANFVGAFESYKASLSA